MRLDATVVPLNYVRIQVVKGGILPGPWATFVPFWDVSQPGVRSQPPTVTDSLSYLGVSVRACSCQVHWQRSRSGSRITRWEADNA